MRNCCIGIKPPIFTFDSQKSSKIARVPPETKLGQKDTSVVCYLPTIKGEMRMEKLRHYSHRNYAILLDTDPEVVSWTTEGTPISFIFRGRELTFMPNFSIVTRSERRVVRLVRERYRGKSNRAEHHRLVAAAYRRIGVDILVVTEESVKADYRIENAELLYWHRVWELPESMKVCVAGLAGNAPATLGDLWELIGGGSEAWPCILALIGRGYVEVAAMGPIDLKTKVTACRMRGFD